MATITDDAVCIRRWDFSETSQTVSLFTRAHGIVRGLAKGAKREKGAFSGGLDVLTRGEVVAIIKPGRDLATLTAWHLQEIYPALRRSLAANRAGLYMADLIHHMLLEHDPHPTLFDAFTQALAGLNDPEAIDTSLLMLQWALLDEAGYRPELDRDAQTGGPLPSDAPTFGFSPKAGGVVLDTAAGDRWRVRRETIEALRAVARSKPGTMPLKWNGTDNGEAIRRANRLLAVYFREIIGSEPPTTRWAFSDQL